MGGQDDSPLTQVSRRSSASSAVTQGPQWKRGIYCCICLMAGRVGGGHVPGCAVSGIVPCISYSKTKQVFLPLCCFRHFCFGLFLMPPISLGYFRYALPSSPWGYPMALFVVHLLVTFWIKWPACNINAVFTRSSFPPTSCLRLDKEDKMPACPHTWGPGQQMPAGGKPWQYGGLEWLEWMGVQKHWPFIVGLRSLALQDQSCF